MIIKERVKKHEEKAAKDAAVEERRRMNDTVGGGGGWQVRDTVGGGIASGRLIVRILIQRPDRITVDLDLERPETYETERNCVVAECNEYFWGSHDIMHRNNLVANI